MRRAFRLLIVLALMTAFVGCGQPPATKATFEELWNFSNFDDVVALLGKPYETNRTETYSSYRFCVSFYGIEGTYYVEQPSEQEEFIAYEWYFFTEDAAKYNEAMEVLQQKGDAVFGEREPLNTDFAWTVMADGRWKRIEMTGIYSKGYHIKLKMTEAVPMCGGG